METHTQLSKKIYLAGPMSNIPYFNFPAFFAGEKVLRDKGFEVIFNPAQHDVDTYGDFWKTCPTGSHEEAKTKDGTPITYRDVLRKDLNWILDNAEAIAFLPGWEKSKGVKAEKALADCLQLEEIYL